LTGKLLEAYKQKIASLRLIPSGGGRFEFVAAGELLYSKLQTHEFPDENALVAAVGARLKKK
jgi:selenoprotein W-related protein